MKYFLIILFSVVQSISILFSNNLVLFGIDNLQSSQFEILRNKSIALLYNEQSKTYNNKDILDLMIADNLNIELLMFPEHGPNAALEAGEIFDHGIYKGLDYISLYSANKYPTSNDLLGIDIIVYDLQDVGSKYYTYISTMTYAMEAAAQNNIEFLILDRPNPINGINVEGPVNLISSFVGMHEIPIRHGMTSGELAQMIMQEGWCDCDNLELNIVPLLGWDRKEYFDTYSNFWNSPSPNIKNIDAALAYNGMCLLEGTNVSEGRGTNSPFLKFGAPWITNDLYDRLNTYSFDGIELIPINFMPVSSKFKGEYCVGLEIRIIDRSKFYPLKFAIILLKVLNDLYPENFKINNFLHTLYGSHSLDCILEDTSCDFYTIFSSWSTSKVIDDFNKNRLKYLIY